MKNMAKKFVVGLAAYVLAFSMLFSGNSLAAKKNDLLTLSEYCLKKGERFEYGCLFDNVEKNGDVLKKTSFTYLPLFRLISVSEESYKVNPPNSEFPLDEIPKKLWENYKNEPKMIWDQIFIDDQKVDGVPDTFARHMQYRATDGTKLLFQEIKKPVSNEERQRKYDGIIKDLVDFVNSKKMI